MPWSLTLPLTDYDRTVATTMAKKAMLGGVSRVRSGQERQDALEEDQIVGQLGQIAMSKYMYGHVQPYVLTRHVQNQNPHIGDGGVDLLGTNVDVKTSLMRAGTDPLRYNLIVRPAERHEDRVYVLALVPPDMNKALLVGWAGTKDLPSETSDDTRFRGAHVLSAAMLWSLPPITHRYT